MATTTHTDQPADLLVIRGGGWQAFADRKRNPYRPTPRQLQTILGLAQGKTHKQIATEQGIAPGTVDDLIRAACYKLRIFNAARISVALVTECIRRGIIAPLLILLALAAPMLSNDDIRRPAAPRPPRPVAARIHRIGRENA